MAEYLQGLFAERIGGKNFGKSTVIYKFEKIKRAKKQALEMHPERKILDFGVGEPDSRANDGVIDILYKEALKPENRFYADNGIIEFKQAAAQYMKNVYNVADLDAENEINHGIGSKSVLALLPHAFVNPGDIVLNTVPGYPVTATISRWLGGEVYNLPLLKENDFLPDLDSIDKETLSKTKILYINYPNNPTGKGASLEFYNQVVEFALKNKIIVISDEAYASLVFNNNEPISFLNAQGAREVGIAVQSLSKAFNMTGWRLAFVAGNAKIVNAFATVKDNNDSGQFRAIQKAGVYALNHPEITEKTREKYSRRHDLLVKALNELNFTCKKPDGTFYLYVACPKRNNKGIEFKSAEEFSQYLIKEKSISTVPFNDAGHFVRFSVTFEAEDTESEKNIIMILKQRLENEGFEF